MLTLETSIRVDGITGAEIFDFLANPDDESYRAWWPGIHLQLHTLARGDDHVGDVVYMDEYIGRRRLRMTAIVTEAVPGKKLVWQLRKWVKLPARLCLALDAYDGGVTITHTTRAGLRGAGRVLDPVLRLVFSRSFARDLDEHVRTEFPLLRDLLRKRRPVVSAPMGE
ncbi:MAG TPA: hypothetical protein VFH48_17310 [Chloroflexota bacterium]|nr:hypothetical protein [Chloroflexota bacterium]